MNTVTVSVVMPVFNAAHSVGRAVESALAQSLRGLEVIIVEDGSSDDTWGALQKYAADPRVVLLRNDRNSGIQRSLNRGLAVARGEFIARIDADDEWLGEDKLQRQVAFLREHPDYVMVGTGAVVVDVAGRELFRYCKPETDVAIRACLLGQNGFIHPSVVMRRAAVMALGGYDESPATRHVEDYDLWLRLGQHGKLANLPDYLIRYGVSDTQIGAKHAKEQFRRNLALMFKYRHAYPGFASALMRNVARLIYHGYLKRQNRGPMDSPVKPGNDNKEPEDDRLL